IALREDYALNRSRPFQPPHALICAWNEISPFWLFRCAGCEQKQVAVSAHSDKGSAVPGC
ncbi:MAG: hypothetical protein WAV78_51150, partial [Xanthobacteraceae bacterium]